MCGGKQIRAILQLSKHMAGFIFQFQPEMNLANTNVACGEERKIGSAVISRPQKKPPLISIEINICYCFYISNISFLFPFRRAVLDIS